jgi:hypothetical protein
MLSQCQAHHTVEYSRCRDRVPEKSYFSDSKIAILNTKPQRVAPIYFKTLARSSSLLISLRSICRACKSTSQRKLESWHTGSIFYVSLNSSLLISLRSICRACKSTSQRKLESWHTGTILEVPRFIYVKHDPRRLRRRAPSRKLSWTPWPLYLKP